MKIYGAEEKRFEYKGVTYVQQLVCCKGGAPIQPCKNFYKEGSANFYRFAPGNDTPGNIVKEKIDWSLAATDLFKNALSKGISADMAEAAIFRGTRKFYRGPGWLLIEAEKLDTKP